MRSRHLIPALLVALLLQIPAFVSRAQFYTEDTERACVRWSSICTPSYELIFPQGLDSLAQTYANTLEWARGAAVEGISYYPAHLERKRLPVVLHPYSAYSNGMSAWTPRYMSLYTCPQAYNPEPTPWTKHLVVHESRHSAQSQYVSSPKFAWTQWLTGDLIGGGLQTLYCGQSFFEGDAVWAETALTQGGRGRSADFLEYIRAAFAEGDVRDWWQWRYGSFGKYTPDYYKIGYLTMASMRALYDPDFVNHYYERLLGSRWPLPVNVWGKTVRAASGMGLKDTWKAIADSLGAAEPAKSRADGSFEQIESFCFVGEDIYAVRKGVRHAAQLVRIGPDGSTKVLRAFAPSLTSTIKSTGDGAVVWSEYVPGVLWGEKEAASDIFSFKDGRLRRLTRGGRFFNPTPCGEDILVSEYTASGSTQLRFIGSGQTFRMPDGVQVVQSASLPGGKILYSAISDKGFGIYELRSGKILFGPVMSKIKDLTAGPDGSALFVCDRTGLDQAYILSDNGTVRQLTSSPRGAGSPNFSGDSLYVTELHSTGRFIVAAEPAADTAGAQEPSPCWPALSHGHVQVKPVPQKTYEVRHYSKIAHALRVHSWLPVYIDYDETSSLSFETLYQNIGLGATVFTQNTLSSLYGSVGYHAKPLADGTWEHSGHAKLTYAALPVKLEGRFDISSANSTNLYIQDIVMEGNKYNVLKPEPKYTTSMSGTLRAYMPLIFNYGGWQRGLVPQLTLGLSNVTLEGWPLNRETISIRAYAVRQMAQDAVFPRWGIGAEVGVAARAFTAEFFRPTAYSVLYGYFPGFAQNQNFHFYALAGSYVGSMSGFFTDPYLTYVTRGFQTSPAACECLDAAKTGVKAYLEYGLPCVPINSGILSPFFYMRNLEVIPRIECAVVGMPDGSREVFASAGALVNMVLGNFLCVPFDTRVGCFFDLNTTTYEPAAESRYRVGFNFTVSL